MDAEILKERIRYWEEDFNYRLGGYEDVDGNNASVELTERRRRLAAEAAAILTALKAMEK